MKTGIVKKIVSAVHDSPKSLNQIAKEADVGWRTCEKYLESLKLLGIVEETRTARERIFTFRRGGGRRGWLFPHTRKILGNKIERSYEIPSEGGVESLE